MRSGKHRCPLSNLAVNNSRLPGARLNIKLFTILGEDLDTLTSHLLSIDKHPAAVVVALELRHRTQPFESALGNHNPNRPRPFLAPVLKPLERTSPTRARIEPQLPRPNNLHIVIPYLELTPPRTVIAPRTEPQVPTTRMPDIRRDNPVTGPVQHATVAQIRPAREDEQRAGRRPRLLEQHGLGDGDDGVVWAQQAAEGEDAVPDRRESRAGA